MTGTCPTCGQRTDAASHDLAAAVVTGAIHPRIAPRLFTAWAAIRASVTDAPGIARVEVVAAVAAGGVVTARTVETLIRAATRHGRLVAHYHHGGHPPRRRVHLFPAGGGPTGQELHT